MRYTEKQINRFNKNVRVVDGGCHEWTGNLSRYGYGRFGINYKVLAAHRVSYEIHNGYLPDNLHVCHSCDNRRCVNPEHLFLGDDFDNMRDAAKKGRMSRGESRPLSKFSDADIPEIRRRAMSGETHASLAKEFGASQPTISKIVTGKTYKHIPLAE